ncbi:HU family DNA-binding protein [Streptomyces xanthochromogenes]|uniref:HU family DNA-binding protein n=1 Tax=Streptomyces xanthochromogenes TaxID=67384 RepID=UPI0037F7EF7F
MSTDMKTLAKLVSKDTNVDEKQVVEVLNSFFDIFLKTVPKDEIELPIGTFRVENRKAREAKNPANGATISVPAQKALRFKTSESVKKQLNG